MFYGDSIVTDDDDTLNMYTYEYTSHFCMYFKKSFVHFYIRRLLYYDDDDDDDDVKPFFRDTKRIEGPEMTCVYIDS